jgi:Zn-dependent peptidase ImmA (M78 family)/DNA-binding Xre family transcriptional regulator
MTKTLINPQMLLMARELKGLTLAELAENLGISVAYLHKLQSDPQVVNPELLKALCRELEMPESFFFQPGELLPSTLTYRKREKVSAKDISRIEANVNLYRLGIEKLLGVVVLKEADLPSLPLTKTKSPEESARLLRKHWGMEKGEIDHLSKIMEEHGVILVSFDFGTDRVDGKCVYTSQGRPVIFTNNRVMGDRQRFTLAYQLGHLVMHAKSEHTFDHDISHEANMFAAEFLLPEKEISKDFKEGITIPVLAKLKRKWKTSMISIAYRAHDLQLITDNQKRYVEQQFNQLKIRRREPVELDIPREQPVLLRDLITKYKTLQKLSTKQLAAFFNLTEKDFLLRYNY